MIGDRVLAKKVANTVKGFRTLQAWLVSLHNEQVHACLETTGVYGDAVGFFTNRGIVSRWSIRCGYRVLQKAISIGTRPTEPMHLP